MNKIEYGIKLYLKKLFNSNFWMMNFVIGVGNFALLSVLTLGVLNQHGENTAAEMAELASALENALFAIAALPFLAVAAMILGARVARRLGYEKSDELWPEVEL